MIRDVVSTQMFEKIILTGGEPSLVPGLLAAGLEECQSCGIQSAVLSAPIWAQNLEGARRFLTKLPEFDFLILSYDRYHLEFLDITHYENAIIAALDRGAKVGIISSYSIPEERLQLLKGFYHLLDRVLGIAFQSVIPIGDAAIADKIPYVGVRIENVTDLDLLNRSCTMGDVVITPEKEINACCWVAHINDSPFRYGGQSSGIRAALAAMEADPLFQKFIRTGLLEGLSRDSAIAIVEAVKGMSFVNECHLCMHLMLTQNQRIWNAYIKNEI